MRPEEELRLCPHHSATEIDQNKVKSPGELRRLVDPQTSGKKNTYYYWCEKLREDNNIKVN